MKIKNYLKTRSVGFWFSVAVILLSVITAAVYAASYAGTDNISWAAFALLLVGAAAGVVLIALKQGKFAPYVLALMAFAAFLCFVEGIYFYVSVVMVGIDIQDGFSAEFIVCALLFVLTFGLGVADIFLSQTKPEKTQTAEEVNDEKAEA